MEVFVFAPPQFSLLYDFPSVQVVTCNFPSKNVIKRTIWENRILPKLLKEFKIDLIFYAGGIITSKYPKNCLAAVAFQNMLIFDKENRRKYSIGYRRLRLALLEKLSRKNFIKADLVIFLSDYCKRIIDNEIPHRKGASIVIPHGLDDNFRTYQKENIPRLKSLPREYLLYVSYLHRIKAQLEVIRAFYKLCQKRETSETLVLAGPKTDKYINLILDEIKKLNLDEKVILTGKIPYNDMPALYHHAKAHIFASTCESFGITILECLGSGRPLFLSKMGPMPELAGDAAVYFDPYKPDELTDLLSQYLDNNNWVNEISKKAVERASLYSWEKTAHKTFTVLQNLIKNKAIQN